MLHVLAAMDCAETVYALVCHSHGWRRPAAVGVGGVLGGSSREIPCVMDRAAPSNWICHLAGEHMGRGVGCRV